MNDTTLNLPAERGRGNRFVGIILIIVGILAMIAPFLTGIAVTAVVGWLLLVAAGAHLIYSWHARGAGSIFWHVIVGLLYLAVGFYLIFHPARGLVTLTLLLACYFVAEGVIEIIIYFRMRGRERSGLFLLDGLITLFLGILIWAHWPFSSVWILGTLVGISLLISGLARLFFRANTPILGGIGVA
jgi:uncharacterized membrane protein HdeD (DUF308 family)